MKQVLQRLVSPTRPPSLASQARGLSAGRSAPEEEAAAANGDDRLAGEDVERDDGSSEGAVRDAGGLSVRSRTRPVAARDTDLNMVNVCVAHLPKHQVFACMHATIVSTICCLGF